MKDIEDEVKDWEARRKLALMDIGVTQNGDMVLGRKGHDTIAKTQSV